jgi:hypothetical protein
VWFTGFAALDQDGQTTKPGESLNLGATVVKHKNFHGVCETVLERVKVTHADRSNRCLRRY